MGCPFCRSVAPKPFSEASQYIVVSAISSKYFKTTALVSMCLISFRTSVWCSNHSKCVSASVNHRNGSATAEVSEETWPGTSYCLADAEQLSCHQGVPYQQRHVPSLDLTDSLCPMYVTEVCLNLTVQVNSVSIVLMHSVVSILLVEYLSKQ